MTYFDPDFLTKTRAAFVSSPVPTLADLKARVEAADDSPTTRRDMLSALNRVEGLFEKSLAKIPATPRHVRELFSAKTPAALGVTEKTLANIRANVSRALRTHGDPPLPLTRRIPPNSDWRSLLDKVDDAHWRQGLYRLACFCTVMSIRPDQLDGAVLMGLHEALEAEEIVKRPKDLVSNTISSWNRCRRDIPEWPNIVLSSPFKKQPWTLPLDEFPDSFQSDVATWERRVTVIDPLDFDGPSRPLSAATIEHRIREFRMFASALVHRGTLTAEEITGLDVLMKPENFKDALRYFLERQDNKPTARLHNLAKSMRLVARHYVKVDEETLSTFARFCKKLNPGNQNQMTEKNRQRLRQFDTEKTVIKFLLLPEKLAKLARAHLAKKPLKAARLMERAVLFGIQTRLALRPRTLRGLNLKRNFVWDRAGKEPRCFLVLFPMDLKMRNHQEFELAPVMVALLDEHLRAFRPHLPWSDSDWLFPGEDGKPRSKNSMYEAIRSAAGKHAGLVMNPHLFRHALAKIVVERDPAAEYAVQRTLGHSTMNPTYAHYLGTETRAAGRHLDGLLERALHDKETT